MQGYKTDESRLIAIFKSSRDNWKTKCVLKQKKIKALEVKLRDTVSSRVKWKHKAKLLQTQLANQNTLLQQKEELLQALQSENQLLKKKFNHFKLN